MKKIFAIIASFLCLMGCSMNDVQSDEQHIEKSSDSITKTESITPESEISSVIFSDINIKEFDLNLLKNNKYPFPQKDYNFDSDNILSNGNKIIADKNLYLEEPSGERTVIIELPDKETNMSVHLYGMIDENRFCYGIYKEFIRNVGIYDLSTDKDFRLDSGYSLEKKINNNLFFSKSTITDFMGFAKLNLDTYELTEIDCSPLLDNNTYYLAGPDISPDGTKAAVYGIVSKSSSPNEMKEYQVAIYSLTEEKILETYNFLSENDYVNHQLLYYSDKQVYLYVSQYGDNPKDFLYIINLN